MADVLNLGAGNVIIGHATNHDLVKHRPEIAVAHDLNDLPWPWADGSFDQIIARAVFEHLRNNLVQTFDECWRILRPGGTLEVKLPHWQSDVSYRDPTHYWQFSPYALHVFDPETEYGRDYAFYTTRKWHIVKGPLMNHAGSSIHCILQVVK